MNNVKMFDGLMVIIPDPNGPDFRKEIYGDIVAELKTNARAFITDSCYGASDIGANFPVYRDGALVGTMAYNGKFYKADPLLEVA